MRKGKRFTPARLRAWQLSGRGTGTGGEYLPWHQVTRSDPGSRGRSHLINWRLGRLHHLLSDHELLIMGFAAMVPDLADIREQFPLSLEFHSHELAAYRSEALKKLAPGTLELASQLGIRHPKLGTKTDRAWWVMTTDLLLTIADSVGTKLLAVSIKYDTDISSSRTLELLALERAYWLSQGVEWLLITPRTYATEVGRTLVKVLPWGLAPERLSESTERICTELKPKIHGTTVQKTLRLLSESLACSQSVASFALWGAVWQGLLPIDLDVRMALMPVLWSQHSLNAAGLDSPGPSLASVKRRVERHCRKNVAFRLKTLNVDLQRATAKSSCVFTAFTRRPKRHNKRCMTRSSRTVM